MSVEQATQNFLDKGEQIAKDSQDLKDELISAVEDVRKQGELIHCSHAVYVCVCCSVSVTTKEVMFFLSLVTFGTKVVGGLLL